MRDKRMAIASILAFALFLAGAFFAYGRLSEEASGFAGIQARPGGEAESEAERAKAPDFAVEDAQGNQVKLSDFAGTPAVVNFWASWCPPCKSEMPEFDKAWEDFGAEAAFLMVDLTDGQRETKETGLQYIEEMGFSFPVYFDSWQEAAAAYGITSIPVTLFIDAEGRIAAGVRGAISGQALRKGIELILTQ